MRTAQQRGVDCSDCLVETLMVESMGCLMEGGTGTGGSYLVTVTSGGVAAESIDCIPNLSVN